MNEAKEIAKAREALDEMKEKINALKRKTEMLCKEISNQKERFFSFKDVNYSSLSEKNSIFLGLL